jgi:hypothetical protein
VPFQAKPEIALMLRDQARQWGIPHRCVVADADYGDNPNFLARLEAWPERYVVGVRVDFRVSARRTSTGPVQRADQLLQRLPRWQWRTIRWRQGAKGWRRKKVIAVDLTAAITIVIPGPFAVGSPLGIPRSNSTKVAGRGRVFAKTAPVSSMS